MKYRYVKKCEKVDENTTLFGGAQVIQVLPEEKRAIFESGYLQSHDISHVLYYNRNRILYKGTVYYSKAYEKPTVFNDTCVRLSDDSFAITEKFFQLAEKSC